MSVQQQNGNGTVKNASSKTTTVTTPKPSVPGKEIKPAAPVVTLPPAAKSDLPPLEDRLHRLNQLFDLQQKYNQLQQSLIKLKNFELGKDDESCRLSFMDKNRNEFATTNQFLMPKFLAFVKAEITAKIKEIEPLLKW